MRQLAEPAITQQEDASMSKPEFILPTAPVLPTESADDLARLRAQVSAALNSHGIVEEIGVLDYIELTWEIIRLRNYKTAILNSAFTSALQDLLRELLGHLGYEYLEAKELAENTAKRWHTNKQTRKWAERVLKQFQLDHSAIEARAYINQSDAIEHIDKLLAAAESRRNKVLRFIAEYRQSLASSLEKTTNRIIDSQVLAIEHVSDGQENTDT
jgi:hypothetical protein